MRSPGLFNVRGRLGEIKLPALVVTGENDTTVPKETQSVLVEGIPKARQVSISGAGHAVIVDQPNIFNMELTTFLEE